MSLLKFFFTEKCSNCGERIEKGAKFCRHCGAGRANSWRKCTGCGVSVAADSQFCWSCQADLSAQPRDQIFSDRWRRLPGIFATRATIETPEDRLRNGIQVDEGTRGALYRDGALKAELAPGYHKQTNFWERLTDSGKSGGFVEALIAVSDPVSSLVSLGAAAGLHTKDYSPVEAAVLVTVKLADFGVFARRMLPAGTDTVRDDDLMLAHTSRVAEVVRRHLSKLDVAEAARSTELRHEIEAALGAELPDLLAEYGLRLVRVEDVRLDSEQITRVREAEGGLSQTARELEWAKKKRELEQSHQLTGLKDEFAFKEQLDLWTHEYTLTSMEREHIITMRHMQIQKEQKIAGVRLTGDVQLTEQEYQLELQRRERDARLAAEEKEHAARLAAEEKKQRAQLDAKAREHQQDMQELETITKMQKERMKMLLELKNQKQGSEGEERRRQAEHDVEMERRRIAALQGVESHIAAAVLPTEKGNQLIRALETLRPQPDVIILSSPPPDHPMPPPGYPMPQPGYPMPQPSFMPQQAPFMPSYMPQPPPGMTPSAYPMGTPSVPMGGTSLEMLAQRYLPCVGVVVLAAPDGAATPMGTAWLWNRDVLVTNAHVAQDMVTAAEAGMSCWVTFSGQSNPVRVSKVRIHPKYAESLARGDRLPAYDVAVLEMQSPISQAGFPIARPEKLLALHELQPVAYIGFPMEGLVGGGVNLERPKAIAKKGSISSLEDWGMRHCDDPSQRHLIKHDLGVAGGASGSPLFDESGDVIGIISAGNMEHIVDPVTKRPRRMPSGVMLNFAQRIDVLWTGWDGK